MTEPWPNGYLKSSALADPLDNPVLQRDSARELAALLEERNENALRLHVERPHGVYAYCERCLEDWPCADVRALTGADEDGAA
jgi:hypothetical protein